MPQPEPTAAPQVRADKVQEDRPCVVCGYNIKGQSVTGRCPECGSPIIRSLQGFLLRFSAPDYVKTLQRGAFVVQLTMILALVQILSIGGYIAAVKLTGHHLSETQWQAANQLASACVGAFKLAGWWLFSMPDPALTTKDPANRSRLAVRAFLGFSAAAYMMNFALTLFPTFREPLVAATGKGGMTTPIITVVAVVGTFALLAQLVGYLATMNYLRLLARRIPDAGLERTAARYRWLLPVITVCTAGIGLIAVAVMYYLLINKWRKRLTDLSRAVMADEIPTIP